LQTILPTGWRLSNHILIFWLVTLRMILKMKRVRKKCRGCPGLRVVFWGECRGVFGVSLPWLASTECRPVQSTIPPPILRILDQQPILCHAQQFTLYSWAINGVNLTAFEAANILKVSVNTVYNRLRKGYAFVNIPMLLFGKLTGRFV